MQLYQVDAFTDRLFGGNPAAVVPLDEWLPDETMQAIALENNLAETAFFVRHDVGYHLRWFTPVQEVDLCGHATLATAYVLYQYRGEDAPQITFHTRSGDLTVLTQGDWLALDLPARPPHPCPQHLDPLAEALGTRPTWVGKARDYLAVFPDEATVRALRPDMRRVAELDCLGVIATAPGEEEGVAFVSRFFAPQAGVPEDPVTGSAHCTLIPYWAEQLGQTVLLAKQVSARGGMLRCALRDDRVSIAGQARLYLQGEIEL